VYTAEIHAICRALLFIWQQCRQRHLFCTHSLGALQSLRGHMPNHTAILNILGHVFRLHKTRESAVFCRRHGITCLPGNEAHLITSLTSHRASGTDVRSSLNRVLCRRGEDACT
jgi:hypothetical protein